MRKYGLARGTRTAVAACTALAFLTACSSESAAPSNSGTFFGPSQPMGNGTIKTFVIVDEAGTPTEVGLRVTRSALDGLPQDTGPGQTLMLDFPDQAAGTAFDHVMLNWNAQGHEPEPLFGKPHFDFHFDMVDMATIEGISPNDADYAAKADRLPDAKYLPQDYVLPPGPPPAQQANVEVDGPTLPQLLHEVGAPHADPRDGARGVRRRTTLAGSGSWSCRRWPS